MQISPLGALVAIVIIGVTVEVVEQQDRRAAYALVILLLLGVIVFNANAFTVQINRVIAAFNAPSRSKKPRARSFGGGGASFG